LLVEDLLLGLGLKVVALGNEAASHYAFKLVASLAGVERLVHSLREFGLDRSVFFPVFYALASALIDLIGIARGSGVMSLHLLLSEVPLALIRIIL